MISPESLLTWIASPAPSRPRAARDGVTRFIVAGAIAENAPDILLVNEFDYSSEAVELFRENYLDGVYPHSFTAPVNTGVDSGLDLDSDGSLGGPNDAYGFGVFPGQYGMQWLSKYPISVEGVRTFQDFLLKAMPDS